MIFNILKIGEIVYARLGKIWYIMVKAAVIPGQW